MLTAASTLRRHGGEDYPEAVEGSMSRRCGLVWEAAARTESTSLEYMELASMGQDEAHPSRPTPRLDAARLRRLAHGGESMMLFGGLHGQEHAC
ncbi:hypothetical protein L1887_63359 [Cichorium endivia]|nr:hypothetical protein L1887_63359 [Cichorium endivia]